MRSAHFWIAGQPRSIAVFLAALIPLVVAWIFLPEEGRELIRQRILSRSGRFLLTGPMIWTAGWFMLLFVKGEDLDLIAPVDVPAFIKIVGGGMVALGFVLCLACFASLK